MSWPRPGACERGFVHRRARCASSFGQSPNLRRALCGQQEGQIPHTKPRGSCPVESGAKTKFVGVELPYERTCPNLPIHPSLFEAAEKMAKENDLDGAVALLERIVGLDPELGIDPAVEAQRLAESDTN